MRLQHVIDQGYNHRFAFLTENRMATTEDNRRGVDLLYPGLSFRSSENKYGHLVFVGSQLRVVKK